MANSINMNANNADKYLLQTQMDNVKNETKTGIEAFINAVYEETQKFRDFPYKTGHLKNESWFQDISAIGEDVINFKFGYSTKDAEHPEYAMAQDYRKKYFTTPLGIVKRRFGKKGLLSKEFLKGIPYPTKVGKFGGTVR